MTVFSTLEVYSRRHAPTWLLFTFSAGFVNAAAFLACDRLVTHVTGTATRIGTELARATIASEFFVVLVCFVLGAMSATLMVEGRRRRGRAPWTRAPFLVEATLLGLVATLGAAGEFGPFGATVDLPPDFVLLSLLSLAMGLQNAAVANATATVVRTTHLTGPATNLGVSLAQLFHAQGSEFDETLRAALFRTAKVFAFVLGGAIAVPICRRLGYLAFFVPTVATLVAMARSFSPAPRVAMTPVVSSRSWSLDPDGRSGAS